MGYRRKAGIDDMTSEEILDAVHDALLQARRELNGKKKKPRAVARPRASKNQR
jgi:hypothetical protein